MVCPAGRRLALPLALFLSPIPPPPFPLRGRGSPKVYFAGGFAPGTPALNRLRHLQFPPCRCLAGSWFLQHGFPLPRRVPVPQQSPKNQFPTSIASAARVQPRGCKGRSPLHKKTKNLPLPHRGRGSGGWGQKKQTQGRVGRRQRRTPPCPQFCPGSAAGNLYGGSYNAGSGLMPGAERQAPGNNFRK